MKLFILVTLFVFSSCSLFDSFSDDRSEYFYSLDTNIAILSSNVEGSNKKDGRYIADKLTEYLLNDSVSVVDRSKVYAVEIAYGFDGRQAFSPKNIQTLNSKLPVEHYIISSFKKVNGDDEYELTFRLVDKSFNLKKIKSNVVRLDRESFYLDLSKEIKKLKNTFN